MFSPSSSSPFRRRRWRLISATAVLPLLAAGSAVLQAPAQAAAPQPPAVQPKPTATHQVTLVTGDVVTVTTLADGKQLADVDRPDGALGGVRMQQVKGDLYVIPDEAVGLLAADKLDRRLFNVTDLIEMGYDDAKSGGLPLIATYAPSKARTATQPAAPKGSKLVRRLAGIRGSALKADKKQARTFWTTVAPQGSVTVGEPKAALGAGVAKLWLDGRVEVNLKESVPLIGAPEAWAAGYTGEGVKVAVLDTGIDVNHPDLKDQIDATASFVPGEAITDVNGHGTHVAGTIVGTGGASGGDYKGVAPDADLIVGKVLGGEEGYGLDSWIIAGMEWAAQQGADVVNMSLGDSYPTDGSDPMSQTVDALSAQYGTLFVIAAGNAGPETISTPGAAASALTVAATDKQDNLAYFSSTGPLAFSGGMKPDIAAPGVDITAARSQEMTDGGEGLYRTISGTSMATPHVVGAAAILAEQHPDWTGAQLKEHLTSTAKGLADWYSPYEVGTGRLDVAAAIKTSVRGTTSLFFGNYTWPHEPADVAVTKELTFTNSGNTDVTLNLALSNAGGPFTLGATSVTIPAGAKATVPVTGDPQAAAPGQRHVGYVIGTDASTGQPVTRSSVGLLKEDERYDLTIKLVGKDGKPASGYVGINLAGDQWPWSAYVEGSLTLRMAPGAYTVVGSIDVPGEKADRLGLAVLADPETILAGGPAEVVLDASKARLLDTEAPRRAQDRQRKIDLNVHYDGIDSWFDYRSAYQVPVMYDDLYVMPTEPMTKGEFTLTTRWRKGEPLIDLSVLGGLVRFDATAQFGSALGTGKETLRTVYAGKGAAADYAKIKAKGKLVVVQRSDEVAPDERAAAAAAAGAKALVVVNDGGGGLLEGVGEAAIPVASVHRDAGKAVITLARLGLPITVQRTEYTPFVYDLTRDYPGQVPDLPLVYKPSHRELAKIDNRFYNAATPGLGSGYRYDLTLSPSLGFHETEWHPGTRTDWVTPGQIWAESHMQNLEGTLPWSMVSGTDTYRADSTTRLDWFAPAVRPAQSNSFGVYNSRARDYMTWNVQAWSSSAENMRLGGYLPWGETPTQLHVYQGDTLIHHNDMSGDMQWKQVPAGNLPYRAVLDAERPGDVFRLSTRTHTEWTFMSDTVDNDYFQRISVLNLDYRLETDLHGDVKAGTTQQISLKPVSMDGGTVPGAITKVTLDVSYDDGATWQKVTLTKGAGGVWAGSFKAGGKAGGFISGRAGAETDAGFSVKNEIIRAYGLR